MEMSFKQFMADLNEDDEIDLQVDREEQSFICPFCGEPIYEEDYPTIEDWKCPICEEELI